MLPEFDMTDSDGRLYREIELPGGRFRMYEDNPYVWNQIMRSADDKSLVQRIEEAYMNGEISKK